MKTKFSDLLKVKKQILLQVENTLLETRIKKQNLLQKLDEIKKEINSQQKPTSGSIGLLKMAYFSINSLNRQKDSIIKSIEDIENEILYLQKEYKIANIEYEKINYLDAQEIEKIKKEKLEQERKDMDEISNVLFVNKNSRVEV
jgi:hypothetical protein